MKRPHLGAERTAAPRLRSPAAAVIVVILTLLAMITPTPAIAGPGSAITGIAWADTALDQTRPATGAIPKSGVTVQLVTPGTNAVVATTTTDANGRYTFANVADGSYNVLVTAPPYLKFPTSLTGSSNRFVSTGTPASNTDPYQGVSQTVTISGATQITNQDAGLQPIATLNVQPLSQPGYNCANGSGEQVAQTDKGNCVTSTLSNVSQAFAVSVSNLGTGQTVSNVIATFTFAPQNGAVLTMPSLPQGCQTTGVTPASSVSGNLTLVCNLGAVNSAQIIAVKPVVVPSAASPNGSSFITSLRARAGDGTAVTSNVATNPAITISGTPNYNTDKTVASNTGAGTYTVNGQPQLGYQIIYLIRGYPQTPVGSATLALPLTIPDAGISQFPNAVITGCGGPSGWYGQNHTPVQNCPTNQTASAASPWNLTFTNYAPSGQQCVNLGGIVCYNTGTNNYATQITVFVPAADVNKAANPAWNPGDPPPTGTVSFQNCLGSGVDGKVDNAGQLNNGNGVMGGQRCVSSSFAVAQSFPSPIQAFKRYNINGTATTDGYFVGPGEPNVQAHLQYVNTSTIADPNFSMCDYFDVSTMLLTAANPVVTQNLPAGFRVEYGVAPNTIDVQVGPPATNGTYPNDPVYRYSNTDQNTIGSNCSRYTGQWATDPTTFGSDWRQKVNLVRIAPIPGFTPTPAAPAGSTVQFYLNFEVQSVYNGGPHAGQTIPNGAYIPNVGSWDRGPLDPTFSSQTAKVHYKQVLPKNVTGSKSYAKGNPSYGTGGIPDSGFNGNGVYTNAGATLLAFVGYRNIGPSPDYDASICDYFDVSTLRLTSAGLIRPTNNGNGSSGIAPPAGFRIEYGVAPNTVNPQVGTPTVGNGYAAPIYQYSNADQQSGALGCSTLDANWTTAPATTFGANWQNVVNVVRLAPIAGFTPTPQIQAGWYGYLSLNFTVRASYNGGANAGAPIPQGAYIPNVGSWDTPQNAAAPVSSQTATVAYLAYQLGLVKTVNTGVSYQPGSQVQWLITPRVTQGVAQRQITGVTVTDVVPANTVFNPACTNASLPPGVTAALNLVTNTVTFTYTNTYVVNPTLPQNLPAVTMCTDILSTVNPGIQISNSARVTSNEAPASVASNTSTITVGGAGRLAISKSVSKPVITSGETYSWGLRWTNNSPVSFAAPQIIDVLPYNGDGSSGASSERLTGSSTFAGTNVLTGALAQPLYAAGSTSTGPAPGTWYYTTAAPASIEQNPGHPSNQSPGTGSSIWVPAASITDWTQVTGVFFSSTGFLNSGDTVTATIPMKANNGTQLGNIYVNQAELYSSSAPANPVVTNNPYTQIPGITILKEASPSTVSRAGETVTYTFTVANQGRVSVGNVSVADTQLPPSVAASLSPITCAALTSPAATCSGTVLPVLAAGQTARFTATYTVTQADVDNGSISDTAVSNAVTNPGGEPITSTPSTALVSATAAPAVDLVKTSLTGSVSSVGEVITYNFRVTNTGNVTLHGISVSDQQIAPAGPLTSGPTCPSGTLAPGSSVDCTATYTVRQVDLDSGTINDTATAAGISPTNVTVRSAQRSASVPVAQAPSIDLIKSVTSPIGPVTALGDVITYNFRVTNTGNVSVQNVTVVDQQLAPAGPLTSGPTCPGGTLAPGASVDCPATYTVTQADLDAGTINDTATANADSPAGNIASAQRSANVPVDQTPTIDLVKTSLTDSVSSVGEVITYNFRVTNTGNVTLHGISVSDQQIPPAGALTTGPTCPAGTVAPGASVDCTATYTVTQADLDAGTIDDTATAAGISPTNVTARSPQRTASVPVAQTASIDLVKSVTSPAGPVTAVGDVITYNFRVTNTGNVSVQNVTVVDQQVAPAGALTSGPTCPAGTLTPGTSVDCTATYTVTQADLDAGTVNDTATANADSPAGNIASAQRSASVPVAQTSSIELVKSAEPSGAADYAAGQQVAYSFVVTNAGNTTLTNVSVSEDAFTGSGSLSAVTCPAGAAPLAPGSQVTCTATYTITQADVERGSTDNTATAHADSPTGAVASPPRSVSLPSLPSPSIDLVKSVASPAGPVTAVGDVITYNFRVTNTGNVSVHSITVSDQQVAPAGALTSGPTCPAGSVLPGFSVDCTATYTVTQADLDAGTVNDTATAHADSPAGNDIVSAQRSASVPVAQTTSIDLAKSVTSPIGPVTALGDVITYNFRVTNTGNVSVQNVTVVDQQLAPAGPLTSGPTCPGGTLAPGASVDCAATYTVTQADLDAGTINDTATAQADSPTGNIASPQRSASVPVVVTGSIGLDKTADVQTIDQVSRVVTYSFLVTNTGQVTLKDVTVTDQQLAPAGPLDGPVTCPETILSPGESTTCTATYIVTQADIDHRRVDDTATARGMPPDDGAPVVSAPDTVSIPVIGQVPSIAVEKSADTDEITSVGQVVTYTFEVTNTGDLTLTGAAVDDVQTAPASPLDAEPVCATTTLAPAESTTCTAAYTVTQADIDNGRVDDTATALGTPPNGAPPVESVPDDLSIPVTGQTASVSLVKSADTDEITQLGQVVTYTFDLTNTGTLSLADIEVVDVQAPPAGDLDADPVCEATTLLPGASTTCTATYTVTQSDLDEGQVDDTATATGTPPGGAESVRSEPDELTIPVGALTRSLSITKTANATSLTGVGQTIDYDFVVKNTGSLTLTDVTVTDTQEFSEDVLSSPVDCPTTTLAPGESMTCNAAMIVSAAAFQRGRIGDTATARAAGGVEGQTVESEDSSVRLDAPPKPSATPPASGGALPVTGLPGAPWVALALGVFIFAAGALLVLSRRKGRAEP